MTSDGTDAGSTERNGANGINVLGSANTIGGTAPGDGNVISGNGLSGIDINGTGITGNLVQGNVIGLDASGANGVGNVWSGIAVSSNAANTTIGGACANAGHERASTSAAPP